MWFVKNIKNWQENAGGVTSFWFRLYGKQRNCAGNAVLDVVCIVYFLKINQKIVLKDTCHIFPPTKDIENMIKFYMDTMQGFMYTNECVICSIK